MALEVKNLQADLMAENRMLSSDQRALKLMTCVNDHQIYAVHCTLAYESSLPSEKRIAVERIEECFLKAINLFYSDIATLFLRYDEICQPENRMSSEVKGDALLNAAQTNQIEFVQRLLAHDLKQSVNKISSIDKGWALCGAAERGYQEFMGLFKQHDSQSEQKIDNEDIRAAWQLLRIFEENKRAKSVPLYVTQSINNPAYTPGYTSSPDNSPPRSASSSPVIFYFVPSPAQQIKF